MPRIIKSCHSRDDYLEIWLYVARDNVGAADLLLDQFDDRLDMLARSPEAGRSEEELSAGLRSFTVGNYLIFYRPIADGIELIRVLHGARDIDPDFFESDQ